MDEIEQIIYNYIQEPADKSIIILYGPTGVGKMTLIRRVLERLLNAETTAMEEDPVYIPYVLVDSVSNELGTFNWKDFYFRILAMEKVDRLDHKTNFYQDQLPSGILKRFSPNRKPVRVGLLQDAAKNAIKNRGVKVLIINDAQLLCTPIYGKRGLDKIDAIKSLANISNALIILVCTNELFEMINISPQLCHRSLRIHFPQYDVNDQIEDQTSR